MNAKALTAALLLAVMLPFGAQTQGFAGLGTAVDGFAVPHPDATLSFPADHGAHSDYRIEWWYLTANLTGADGTAYGVQWTLFRSALSPEGEIAPWQGRNLWLAHAALTTPEAHFVAERMARDGAGQAGVTAAPFTAFLDEWHMTATGEGIADLSLTAQGRDFAYDLALSTDRPLVLQGQNGYSVKSASGQASYYYSQPFYRVSGTLTLPQGDVPVTGQAWLDREWSSQPLAAEQSGWDWISLHLEDGAKLMGFRLRDDGAGFTSATYVSPEGITTPYGDGALTLTPGETTQVAGRRLPTTWRVDLPAQRIAATITALNPQAWMDTSLPYWEGPVTVSGSHGGVGYLEMTGY